MFVYVFSPIELQKAKKLRGKKKAKFVMKEWEQGELHSGGSGETVPKTQEGAKQAYAVAMSEAGMSKKAREKGKAHKSMVELTIYSPLELVKGKRMPIGTVSHGYKKVAEGKWVPVPKEGKRDRDSAETARPAESDESHHEELMRVYDEEKEKSDSQTAYMKMWRRAEELVGHDPDHTKHAKLMQDVGRKLRGPRPKTSKPGSFGTGGGMYGRGYVPGAGV